MIYLLTLSILAALKVAVLAAGVTCLFQSNVPSVWLPAAVVGAVIPDIDASKGRMFMQTKCAPTDGGGAESLKARAEPHTRRDILTGIRSVLKCTSSGGFPRDRRVTV